MALETEELIGFNPKSKRQHHHHLSSAKFIERQNKVELLFNVYLRHAAFWKYCTTVYNVMTEQVVPKVIEEDILKFETRRGGGNTMKLYCFKF